MGKSEKKLYKRAKEIYKHITPCGSKKDFSECFTKYENKIFFWFDTEDDSTHLLIEEQTL